MTWGELSDAVYAEYDEGGETELMEYEVVYDGLISGNGSINQFVVDGNQRKVILS